MMKTYHFDNIPNELKAQKRWVCWEANKTPVQPSRGGKPAQSNHPETWTDFDAAVEGADMYAGIGFMLGDGYIGVDLDDIEDDLTAYRAGDKTNRVFEFVSTLNSYAEVSPSGKGLHVICKGTFPPGGKRKGKVEMYDGGRFFTVTGNAVTNCREIADCTESIKVLHEKYIGKPQPHAEADYTPLGGVIASDDEIVCMAQNASNGAEFTRLYNGDAGKDHSAADLALCNFLAYWTGKDASRMDAIFRTSGLMRKKWDEKHGADTYGNMTIRKAIESVRDVYKPYSIMIGGEKQTVKLFSHDDVGNAERLIDLYGENLHYCYDFKKWLCWDGKKWDTDTDGGILRIVDNVLARLNQEREVFLNTQPADADLAEMGKKFDKHIKYTRGIKAISAMETLARHDGKIAIKPERLDAHKEVINTPSGIIDLKTGELRPHDRGLMMTKMAGTGYGSIPTPIWLKFLNTTFKGDSDLIRFVQKAAGYSLTGLTSEECVFFCYGTGRNGKSKFLQVIKEILGDYADTAQSDTILARNNFGGTSDLARLKGARFVLVSELDEGARLKEGLIKQMTGGNNITAARKYENETTYTPEFKLWNETNHKPIIRGTDEGIWSRIRLIPFTNFIPSEERDSQLIDKLRCEYPGILKWMVDGCMMWRKEGLKPPKIVENATREYESEMNIISAFLEECCVEDANATVQAGELFKAYAQWANEHNEYEMTATRFGREMGKKFEKRTLSGGYKFYHGLKLNDDCKPYQITIGNL